MLDSDLAVDDRDWKPKKVYSAKAFEHQYYESNVARLAIQVMYHLANNPATHPDAHLLWWYDTFYWLWRDKMSDIAEKETPYLAKLVDSILNDAEQGDSAFSSYEIAHEDDFDLTHLLNDETLEQYKNRQYDLYLEYLKKVKTQLDTIVRRYNIFTGIFYKPKYRNNERYAYGNLRQ